MAKKRLYSETENDSSRIQAERDIFLSICLGMLGFLVSGLSVICSFSQNTGTRKSLCFACSVGLLKPVLMLIIKQADVINRLFTFWCRLKGRITQDLESCFHTTELLHTTVQKRIRFSKRVSSRVMQF